MNTRIVDVQPAYQRWCDALLPALIAELSARPEHERFALLWVDELTGDTKADVLTYWSEAGASDSLLERMTPVPKSYGFFRQWMDNGIPDEELLTVLRELRRAGLSDSRDLCAEWMETHAPCASDLTGPVYLPPELEGLRFFEQVPLWHTCGGGRDECLREVELWLASKHVAFRRLDHLTY